MITSSNEIENKYSTLRFEATKKENMIKSLNEDVPQITHSNEIPLRRKERAFNKLTNSVKKAKEDGRCVKTTHNKERNDSQA